MTAQVSDKVNFEECVYAIAAICGGDLFSPSQIGVKPIATSSASWRGFHCEYLVEGDRLLLSQLVIGLDAGDVKLGRIRIFEKTPEPCGFTGRKNSEHDLGIHPRNYLIGNLREPIPFSGGLLLGHDFIRELYVHMGFHPAYKFRKVIELILEDGRMTHAFDRSEEAAMIRARLDKLDINGADHRPTRDIQQFIEDAFSLDYGFSRFFKH